MKQIALLSNAAMAVFCSVLAGEIRADTEQSWYDEQAAALDSAINETHYSAVVAHTDFLVVEGDYYEERVYVADVLKTIRGQQQASIEYRVLVKPGEEALFRLDPVIVTLCYENGSYYLPTKSAQLGYEPMFLELALSQVADFDAEQEVFAQCR
ncbi:hypothetical protein [Thaumasiovibrio subtropicus]|uniref:hypothetical protein n=1 Tax=Thaumasiovibrio subtropicus TaxID=1891207 RepID=UPI000B361439|nr:hypothetical protein [Thaumasiovibrio subtropicus]